MTMACIADRFARSDSRDLRIRRLLDSTNVIVVPMANPDGYAYSWSTDRYWRKNRRDDHGVDLNRNWPVAFGGRGASPDPRSPTYHGEHALSEPESETLRDLVRAERPFLHVDFHSYSQKVLFPWSYTTRKAPDRKSLSAAAKRYADVVRSVHGVEYTPSSGGAVSRAGGTMMD